MATDAERRIALCQLDRWLERPMLLLGAAWLVLLLIELVGGSSRLLETLGTAIWAIFIAEFLFRILLAPDKPAFLRKNWLQLLALALPALRVFRIFRLARAARGLRGLRLVRIVGTANRSMNALRRTLRRRRAGYVAGLSLLVLLLGAAGMFSFEREAEVTGGFADFWDALWWTAMLLTTIGSAYWPVTTEGRLLALLLSAYSVAVLGYIAATFASFFIGRDAQSRSGPVAGSNEVSRLAAEVRALREHLARNGHSP